MNHRLLTTLTAALLALSAWANGTEINGIYYVLDSDTKTASVTYTGSYSYSNNSYSGSITIPASVTNPNDGTTYSVTSIGYAAFNECTGLTSITIPNSVTTIGSSAFYHCTGLTSITIPSSVTSIGEGAFYVCIGLTSITIPNSVTSIGSGAFNNCTGLTSITIPNSVTTIGDQAFLGCTGLTSIDIPNSVTSIGSNAFLGCSGLTSIKVETGNTKYDSRDNCNAIIETATNTLIAGCNATTIPNSVTSIGNYAFNGCEALTSITIPNSVTSIGVSAFYGCTGLTSITIPNSVTSIGDQAFRGCTGLTSITIPNSVRSIGERVFYGCALTSINLPEGLTEIGSYAFSYNSLQEIRLPASVVKLGDNPFAAQRDANQNGCLQRIVVAEGNPAYEVAAGALYTKGLTEIVCFPSNGGTSFTMPATLRRIGISAFSGSKVRDVYFTSPVIEGQGASGLASDAEEMNFYVDDLAVFCRFNPIDDYDGSLYLPWHDFNLYHKGSLVTDLVIPEGIDTLCTEAFVRCKSIRSVTFPSTFRYTRQYTFWDCPNLKRVVLNEGLEGLGVFSFLRSPLQEIHAPMRKPWSFSFPGDDVGISDWLHQYCFGDPTDKYTDAAIYSEAILFVPSGCVETYRNTEGWNAFSTIVEENDAYGENVYPTNVYRGTDGKSSYYVVTTISADGNPQLYVVRELPDGSKYAIMSADEVQFDADIASVTATETENSFLGPKQSVSLTLHLLKNKARLYLPDAEAIDCTLTPQLPLARTTYNSQDQFGPAFEMLDDSTARILFPDAEDVEEASVSYQNERAEWTFTGKQSGKVLKVSANSQCQLTATDRGISYLFLPESSPAPLERYAEGTYTTSFFTSSTGGNYTYSATLYRNRLNSDQYALKPFIDNEEGIILTLTDEENEDGYRIVDVTPAKTDYTHPSYGMIWAQDARDYGIGNTRSYFDGRTFFLNLAYYVSAGNFGAFADTFTLNIPEGDLNGDYTVNVGDVTTLVNMILGKTPMSDDADLNGDDAVNVGDVTTLVNQILGKYPSRAAYHRPTNKTMQTSVGMRCYVIQPALSHRTAEPQRGQLVVVRRADGTSRKMYVR